LSPIEANEYPLPVLRAYCYWLKIRTYYGWQVPIKQVLELAGTEKHEIRPETWLWKLREGKDIRSADYWLPRVLVDSYADAIAGGVRQPLRTEFLRWLDWMIRHEETERETYSDMLERLEQAKVPELDKLPFAIRYRYGSHLGWDIPTWREWEKAYRGADDRVYSWGNAENYWNAQLNRLRYGEGPRTEVAADFPLNDKSPYGVRHMAGNLSEWVRVSENPLQRVVLENGTSALIPKETAWQASFPARVFLKGGNYVLNGRFANVGYALSLPAAVRFRGSDDNDETTWSGVRVIRRIGSLMLENP
jgi:hypothetical protein